MLTLTSQQKEAVSARFSENALKMMKKRYLIVDEKGNQEAPADMFARVAYALAKVEEKYGKDKEGVRKIAQDFYEIMARKEYTPAGRTMRNAGAETSLVANCIVLPIHDSMDSIFGTLRDAALLQQAGSGLGFDLSEMRPAMSPTKKSQGVASGPVSFLRVYDTAFGTIKQQCFAKGTRIVTKRGLLPIEEVQKGDETFTEKGWKKVTEVFFNGVRDTLKLTLDSGFEVELTPNHKVAVIQNGAIALKQVKDLTAEDVLLMKLGDNADANRGFQELEQVEISSSRARVIRQPEVLDEKLAYFLGLYYSDGNNDSQGIRIAIHDADSEEKGFRSLVANLFGITPFLEKHYDGCRKFHVSSQMLKRFFQKNNLLKQYAYEIEVPEKIFRSPSSVQMAFIAGFFDGDGDNGKNYRLNTSSKTFAQQLQLMLIANSIGAKIKQEQRRANWRIVYRVGVIGKDSTHRFYEKLSFHSWKIQKKEETKDFGWIFPFHPVRDLGYSWLDIKRLHDGVRSTISHSILSQIQAQALLRQAEAVVQQKIDWTGFLPVKMKSIEQAGKQEVYDFEVEDIHMINAGLYTSNSRHGANMAMMRVDHPDILDFIDCKKNEGEIRNFNISVTVTDEFMKQLQEDPAQLWYSTFKGNKMKPHKVLRHPNGAVYDAEEIDITVQELFDKLVEGAWTNGEPGIAFIDTVNKTNPLPGLGSIAVSNPCGEQFLHPYDNCNLGSINLAEFVKDGNVNWERLRFSTKTAVRLMDNVIDKFDFPVEQVTELALKNRRIGLGIMGFADMLYQLRIPYNSKEGFAMAEKVMGFINEEAHKMSQELAVEKGAFPNHEKSVFAKQNIKMRNAALTTVAPTGSIAMMFDTSSGIEPNFALAYVKQDKDGFQYRYFNRFFQKALEALHLGEEEKSRILDEVIDKGSIQDIEGLPQELKNVFVVAMDIAGSSHMEMQAAFQRNVDNSISKTINFKNEATREDVADAFVSAWKLGCKAATVYRDGSRMIQILNVGKGDNIVAPTELPNKRKEDENSNANSSGGDFNKPFVRPRPDVMTGQTYKMKTGYGSLFITINNDERGEPFEVFATIGKSGGFFQEQTEAITRLISLSLRAGVEVKEVIDSIEGIRGPMPIFTNKGTVLSLPDAIGKVLKEHIGSVREVEDVLKRPENQEVLAFAKEGSKKSMADFGFMPGCPECGNVLTMQEGCISCHGCGFSRCS
ncbi:MAG: adenosylcobalamin-dependent ribonucleoside-diphosphate reductase [Candidatus Yanofskybacteria bacterium]|nr:adenosylcobalamin-dependent ribonucleoside-diphosphate reductase [Candidatus Yanofskybacteria bacterium]